MRPEAGRSQAEAGTGRGETGAALLFGAAAAFVAGVDLVRWVRPALLVDPEPAWALARLLLAVLVIAGTAGAGVLATALFRSLARRYGQALSLAAFPARPAAIAAIAAAAVVLGAAARFAELSTSPPSLWIDDLTLIAPALDLEGKPSDFRDAIRPAPYGVAKPYGSVGVFYLELYRLALRAFGTTIFGVRFLSAAAGVLSLLTALALGRALLPAGGGALAALVLAGLRWHLLMSRWGWNAIVLAPIADLAALLLLSARRRKSAGLAALAGAVAGIGAHVYLAAWIVAVGLVLLAAWPREGTVGFRPSIARPLLFAAGFALAAAPLFLLREGREAPYFARPVDHSAAAEMRYARSAMPLFAAAADSLVAPWLKEDPYRNHDLPGKSRLGWILGPPVALVLARSLLRPREPLSAYLLCQGCAAFAASVAGGHAGVPNGYRFAYLSDVAAVAAAGGVLCILGLLPASSRHTAAIAAVGFLAVSGALSARDVLMDWPARRDTFDAFHGQDTLLARTALRWERYGRVEISPGLGHSPLTIRAVRNHRLDAGDHGDGGAAGNLLVRIEPAGAIPETGERVVERVRDAWGRDWARVLARPLTARH